MSPWGVGRIWGYCRGRGRLAEFTKRGRVAPFPNTLPECYQLRCLIRFLIFVLTSILFSDVPHVGSCCRRTVGNEFPSRAVFLHDGSR